ncbi:hypothetical protein AWN90_06150 [Nocardia terpenica]|uniref:Uncharacterized protein n=1 Tax=Nocardia terpenica TaxID=455432 RepID=A0A164J866_9NOCA|nr:hypothetical protein AWN90_06150 [Nocardia terpenica]
MNRARADRSAAARPKTKVAQLGASEYCSPTSATSPPKRRSSPSAAWPSIQPEPVGTTTTRFDRRRPPDRSSSLIARATRESRSGADSRPTYTRTPRCGCPATNRRPCAPSEGQLTAEPVLPDREYETGCTTSGSSSALAAAYACSRHCTSAGTTANCVASTASTPSPTLRIRPNLRTVHRNPRTTPIARATTTTAPSRHCTQYPGPTPGKFMAARNRFCQ